MLRMLHPARLLRYGVYFAAIGTILVTIYTLLAFLFSGLAPNKHVYDDNLSPQQRATQDMISYIGEHLDVRYHLIEHVDYRTRGQITLSNAGRQLVKPGNWSLFIFYMSPIDTDLFNYGSDPEPWFKIFRMQGNLYRLTPTSFFKQLRPQESVKLELFSGTWIMAYTDLLPNWYVSSPGLPPKILANTAETQYHEPDFVDKFSDKVSIRADGDPFPPLTRGKRYLKNKVLTPERYFLPILPYPLLVDRLGIDQEVLTIDTNWVVVALKDVQFEAKLLKEKFHLKAAEKRPDTRYIALTIGNVPLPADSGIGISSQAYSINMDKDGESINIVGQSPAGVFYAVQTLFSLYDTESRSLLLVKIVDAPRFEYRGIMIDLARNFHSNKDELMRVVEGISMYKMNKLHLHLGDDEGWRLEIPGLPELTQIGAHRCHDMREKHCIMPGLGSGPFINSSGSGYLSVQDYTELITFAAERHVQVIPEFDMPGHGRAAIHSMELRYHRLSGEGQHDKAREYLLSDPKDRSLYMSGQFFTDNAINPCMESTYRFVEHVIEELIKLHQDINPLTNFHFGGDEVPENAYMESPACQAYMSSHPELVDTRDLKIHFIKRIAAIAARHHIGLQGWEDAFYGKNVLPMDLRDLHNSKNIVTNVWWNMWEAGIGHRANELANHDYKVVISHSTHFYFDHVQEPDPAERGLYWSIRYIDTKRVFSYIPGDIYENIDMHGMGEPWSRDEACGQVVNCVPLEKPHNVIGLQGSMWGETVRTRSHQNMMLFPRVLALAERAWHKPDWEAQDPEARRKTRQYDWARFTHLVGRKELKRLEALDIHYRLPPPGADFKSGGYLDVNTEYPGVVVQYSVDGGASWRDWDKPMKIRGNVLLASRDLTRRKSQSELRRLDSERIFKDSSQDEEIELEKEALGFIPKRKSQLGPTTATMKTLFPTTTKSISLVKLKSQLK